MTPPPDAPPAATLEKKPAVEEKKAPAPAELKSASATAPQEVGSPPASATGNGFSFGSYGRIGIGIDGRGHEGYAVNVVSHGSRLEAPPYLELDLYYGGTIPLTDARWRVVLAPAFNAELFHYSGNFTSRFAVRNAYAEIAGLGHKGLSLWVGSRMLRGDDVYLFDYWPLDNLNTIGGGANLRLAERFDIQVHAGLNRLDTPFQYQTTAVPARGLGAPGQALTLDRPRSIASLKLTYRLGPLHGERGATWGAKVSLYGELHVLPAGERTFVSQQRTEKLPADTGWVVGAQVGGWLRPQTFANVFVRFAGGLAAYGELTPPITLGADLKTSNARELLVALSLNYETRWVGVMAGAFLRGFTDGSPGAYNPLSYIEGIVAARPQVFLTRWFHIAAEVSYQERQYGGFDDLAGRRLQPRVFRASLIPLVAPLGPGTYSRPIIYAVGTLSVLDDDARAVMFENGDLRRNTGLVGYVGLGAEWWFQSSYR